MVHPNPAEHATQDPLTSANVSRIDAAEPGITPNASHPRSAGTTSIGRHQDRAPFSRKLTRSLFFRPAHLIGKPPSYAQSIRSALTYSVVNALLVFNPIAWALHYTNQNTNATFACALLGIVPLAGLLGHGTETIALYTGDALGGLINASLGNATEFIIAILLLLKCELRVVQASLLGGLLSNLLLVTGMAFLVGGFRFNEQEFQQTAAQLNTSLMTLAVISLVLPTVFAFAIEQASGEDQERRLILEMSRGASLILILIYVSRGFAFLFALTHTNLRFFQVSYMVFQLYSHSYLYNPDAEYEIRSDSSSSSSCTSSSTSSRPTSPIPVDEAPSKSGKLSSKSKADQISPAAIQEEPTEITSSPSGSSSSAIPAPSTPGPTTTLRATHGQLQVHPHPTHPNTNTHLYLHPHVRRANSLPFGSAAALGRGNRYPITPGVDWREVEKQEEIQSRGMGYGATQRGPAYVHRSPAYINQRTAPRVAFDLEGQGPRTGSSSTVGGQVREVETPEMNMITAIVLLLGTTGLTCTLLFLVVYVGPVLTGNWNRSDG